jgi:hypothetical protein
MLNERFHLLLAATRYGPYSNSNQRNSFTSTDNMQVGFFKPIVVLSCKIILGHTEWTEIIVLPLKWVHASK